MGIVVAIILIRIPHTHAETAGMSIHYAQSYSFGIYGDIVTVLYGAATIVPLLISSIRKLWIMGLVVALVGIIVYLVDAYFFVSVWCFFAALVSLLLFFIFKSNR